MIMKKVSKALAVLVIILTASLAVPENTIPYYGTVDVQAATKKLNATKSTLIKGNTLTLKLSGVSSSKVKWTSSKLSVATVKKGIVTAQKKAGKAVITAKYKGKKYTCKVYVETPSISKTSLNINVGDTTKLKISGTSQKIKWSSSDTSIATVNSSGKVTGIDEGTTKITAKIGSNKYKCTVTVKDTSEDTEQSDTPEVTYGTVSGNVTYFYNNYKGHVADASAKVILINTNKSALNMPQLSAYVDWNLPTIINGYNNYGVYETTVDGTGSYTFNHIPTGTYRVVVISLNTTSKAAFDDKTSYAKSLTDYVTGIILQENANMLGQSVGYKKFTTSNITIYSNENTVYSYDFGITYI